MGSVNLTQVVPFVGFGVGGDAAEHEAERDRDPHLVHESVRTQMRNDADGLSIRLLSR